jgi:hypothetical protein
MSKPNAMNPGEAVCRLEAVELSRLTLDALRSPAESKERDSLDHFAGQLNGIDPGEIEGDAARIAFWANLYNALLLHRLSISPARGSMLRHPRIFSSSAYGVGGSTYSLNQIEHGVLRVNRRAPLQPRSPFRGGDPRLRSLPSRLDPRIHFALNCGARSCPPIRSYDPAGLDADLELATRAYLRAETVIDRARRVVTLPRLMRLYAPDFGSRLEQVAFASAHLPELAALQAEGGRGVKVRYGRFDWTAVPAPPGSGSR